MFSAAKTLPLVLATVGALLFASAAQAGSYIPALPDFGASPSTFVTPTELPTFEPFPGVTSEEQGLLSFASDIGGQAEILAYAGRGEMSSLPSPATWAMMLAGFGMAGAMLRRGQLYRLVEHAANGDTQTEDFHAPDDKCAIERALSVAEGVRLEIWRGDELVQRVDAPSRATG
ncbi:PEPxxWA-CTERM sorting domain-containing protein [Phenylobacterium sp.]|jgi:hypothetical protein|uniref:PEPxxWA-CTERM sorting domain-containing protein n=1 Tax=Phenylobacterium sp. TaxID=1871053 RepID=UPI0037CB3DE9